MSILYTVSIVILTEDERYATPNGFLSIKNGLFTETHKDSAVLYSFINFIAHLDILIVIYYVALYFPSSISHYLTRQISYGKSERTYYFKNDARIYLFACFVFTCGYVEKSAGIIIILCKKKKRMYDIVDNIEKYANEYLFLLLFVTIARCYCKLRPYQMSD